tara:strand:+ start:151 stop:390 length:240 start_codon:yes stop_codon:yes gene_type:complete
MGYFKVTGGVTTAFFQKEEKYWFKNNGKTITQKEYCSLQSKIDQNTGEGGMGLQTSHPDACGLKAKREKQRKNNQKKPK